MESFIVRVMHGDDDDHAGEPGEPGAVPGVVSGVVRGVVRRVNDGSEATFSDADELLALLRTRGSTPGSEEPT